MAETKQPVFFYKGPWPCNGNRHLYTEQNQQHLSARILCEWFLREDRTKRNSSSSVTPAPLPCHLWHFFISMGIYMLGYGLMICSYRYTICFLPGNRLLPHSKESKLHCSLSPQGRESWSRGKYHEVTWPQGNTCTYLYITSCARLGFVLRAAGTGCSCYNYKQERVFIHDRLQMWDPHLDRTCDPCRQTGLLYSFESYSDGFLDPHVLDYNTTKPTQKNKNKIPPTKLKHTCNKSRSLAGWWQIYLVCNLHPPKVPGSHR